MHRLRWAPIVAFLFCSGCLFSSTRVFEYDVLGNANLAPPLRVTGSQMGEAYVELIRSRVYEESRNDIEVVDRAAFAGSIRNAGGAPATLTVYVADEAGLTDPALEAIPVLSVAIPPAGRTLSFEDAEKDMRNLPLLRDAVRNGGFHLYLCSGPGDDLDVETLRLIVALTVEP